MFSVIIPAYNAASYIQKSINSVLKQTCGDFEILVVDDGSTDDTKEMISSIDDERIRYIYQPNGGVSSARNAGICNARGEYICFLDADDVWKPRHLEVVSGLIDKYPETVVFLTGHEIVLHDGHIITKFCPNMGTDVQADNMFEYIFEYGYFIHTNSVVCRRNVFDTIGLFEVGIKNGEDDDMWYRIFAYFSVAISKEVTTTYIRENSRATEARTFVKDWIFLHRVEGIMLDADVSKDKKVYLNRLLEQRKVSLVRYCVLTGDKRTAWKYMRKIDKKLIKKKKYVETLLALIIPYKITSFFIRRRDMKYYSA